VQPVTKKFNVTVYRKELMLQTVQSISELPGAIHNNRLGILLDNASTEASTLTLTHTL
jgi:hypothetical protein